MADNVSSQYTNLFGSLAGRPAMPALPGANTAATVPLQPQDSMSLQSNRPDMAIAVPRQTVTATDDMRAELIALQADLQRINKQVEGLIKRLDAQQAPGPANVPQPGPANVPQTQAPAPAVLPTGPYTTQAGDYLWKVAKEQLGDANRWTEIYALNKDQIGDNPNLLYPGQVLKMPARYVQQQPTPGSVGPQYPNQPGANTPAAPGWPPQQPTWPPAPDYPPYPGPNNNPPGLPQAPPQLPPGANNPFPPALPPIQPPNGPMPQPPGLPPQFPPANNFPPAPPQFPPQNNWPPQVPQQPPFPQQPPQFPPQNNWPPQVPQQPPFPQQPFPQQPFPQQPFPQQPVQGPSDVPQPPPSNRQLSDQDVLNVAMQYGLSRPGTPVSQDMRNNVRAFLDEMDSYETSQRTKVFGPGIERLAQNPTEAQQIRASIQQIQQALDLLIKNGRLRVMDSQGRPVQSIPATGSFFKLDASGQPLRGANGVEQIDDALAAAVTQFKDSQGIHQNYRLADGTYAINEYVGPSTVAALKNALMALQGQR